MFSNANHRLCFTSSMLWWITILLKLMPSSMLGSAWKLSPHTDDLHISAGYNCMLFYWRLLSYLLIVRHTDFDAHGLSPRGIRWECDFVCIDSEWDSRAASPQFPMTLLCILLKSHSESLLRFYTQSPIPSPLFRRRKRSLIKNVLRAQSVCT